MSNLAYGTRAENAADRERHGRTARGERNARSSLMAEDVALIKFWRAKGTRLRELASAFKISESHVSAIAAGKVWSHVKQFTPLPAAPTTAQAA